MNRLLLSYIDGTSEKAEFLESYNKISVFSYHEYEGKVNNWTFFKDNQLSPHSEYGNYYCVYLS